MKVICIEESNKYLTKGKEYEVYPNQDARHTESYTVIDDQGELAPYYKTRFKEVPQMSKVSYHVLPNSIVINWQGKNWNLNKGDARFKSVLEAIKADKLDDIPKLLDVSKVYGVAGLKVKDNSLWLDGEQLHGVLADRILALQSEGLPFEPLVKFARKLKKNPSMNSREQLYKFLEHNGHPLTSEGNFIAYRGVREDFKDVHSGTFDNSVGSICSMDRAQVDDNPNNTCSRGLHVACYSYASTFGQRLVEVEVDPQDVVCVPTDYNGTKMRTCKFKVVSLCEGINESQLVSSSYEPSHEEFEGVESLDDEGEEMLEDNTCPGCDDNDCGTDDEETDENDWQELLLKPSDVVESAEYQSETGLLDVYLKDGTCYRYSDVPERLTYEWEEFYSTGAYFVRYIAHTFKFTKIA